MQPDVVEQRLDRVFHALAHHTRRALLARLKQGPARVGELARPHRMSLNAISKHLFVLEDAGLIRRSRDGQGQACALLAAPLVDAETWIAGYRQFWQDKLDRLATFAERPDGDE